MKNNFSKQELNYEKIVLLLSITALIVNYLRYQAKLKQLK
jgi:hypothetical protein